MRATNCRLGLLFSITFFAASIAVNNDKAADRTKKHFSLFSVVTFKNDECTSESSLTGGARQGTCYSTTECNDKNGMKSGNCASGFGVCCLFIENSGASATVQQNRTYLRNSEYPNVKAATAAETIAYTMQKMTSDICQIRLDFNAFVIAGPANTKENVPGTTSTSHCNADQMTLVQTGGDEMPIICGSITGEHLYVDLGMAAADTSVLQIKTYLIAAAPGATIANRIWDIKTSQIECYASYRAPQGCHRYFTQDYGKIISLNFLWVTGTTRTDQSATAGQNTGVELAGQKINTCIRRSKGMCCVEYQVCQTYAGIALTQTIGTLGTNLGTEGIYSEGWSIDTQTGPFVIDGTEDNVGMVDTQCSGDYVEVPSSWSGACNGMSSRVTINTRYCGARFGANFMASITIMAHGPVCDCSEPFNVRHHSDLSDDLGGTARVAQDDAQALIPHRGFCLDFTQQPCYF